MSALRPESKGLPKVLGLLVVFLILLCYPIQQAVSQKASKNDLEERKRKIQQEIEETRNLLSETKKNKKLTISTMMALNKQISNRQELIAMISGQLSLLSRQISETNQSIEVLQDKLQTLKNEYAQLIYSAYRNKDGYNRLMFVFASADFNQAFMRLKYLQQYSDYRHQQATQIVEHQTELNEKLLELEKAKAEKKQLLGAQEVEKKNLSREKNEKEELLSDLQSKEKQLKADLERKRKDAEKLQQAILRLIHDEIEKSNKGKSKSNGTAKIVLTPEAQQLSSSFNTNKSKLPWPVLQGVIIDPFGSHPHPTMKDITINNNGVDIATSKGSLARAVFDGEVTGVATLPSKGQVVIVRHGDFLTVYAYLNDVYVKAGDKVKTKQNLGNIVLDSEEGKTQLHFEIWKGSNKLDPEEWLFKK